MPAFEVKFECMNCGNVWWQEFERGDRILEETLKGVYLHSHKCTKDMCCPYCRYIECPVCGLERDVKVRERKPKGEEVDDPPCPAEVRVACLWWDGRCPVIKGRHPCGALPKERNTTMCMRRSDEQ